VDRKVTDLIFPVRGIDLQTAFGVQRPHTTPCCKNCLGHEPCSGRRRGGRRPGLGRLDGQVPAGSTLIQHLGQIVVGSTAALYPPDYPWGGPTVPMIQAPGPPWTWGGAPIVPGWDDEPITGEDLETQDPSGGKKKRKKGSGIPPNPNQIGLVNGGGSYRMFQCIGQVNITVHTSPIDYFGTNPSYAGCLCIDEFYLRLAGPPTDARHFFNWWCKKVHDFTVKNIPQNGYAFLGSTIIGNTSGDPSTWGIGSCGPGDDNVEPCAPGYDPRNNVASLGFAECCGLMLLAPQELGVIVAGGPALTAVQSFGSCREAG
jgi:hypothetical protein